MTARLKTLNSAKEEEDNYRVDDRKVTSEWKTKTSTKKAEEVDCRTEDTKQH